MKRRKGTALLMATMAFLTTAVVGCSSGPGQSLGLSAPQHKLLPQTKEFRSISPAPNAPRELTKILQPAHVVEPGDVLLVQPAELDAPVRIAADQPVLPDGTIDLGSFGRPVVAGKTVPVIEAEIQQAVKSRLKAGESVTINVRLINRNSKVFYVLGEVNAPGAFPITGRETVLDGIISAGGLTRRASERNIVISRPTLPCDCRIVKPVCYTQIVQLGDTTTNYQIMPGDRIFVPSKTLLEDICPNGCKKKTCDVCDTPQTLCPMDRPGCATGDCGAAAPTAAGGIAATCGPNGCNVPGVASGWGLMSKRRMGFGRQAVEAGSNEVIVVEADAPTPPPPPVTPQLPLPQVMPRSDR